MEVAYTLNNLGWVYIDRDDLATADSLFRRSLAIRQKSVGNKHPSVGLAMHNLATLVYFPKNDLDGAEVLITGALEIFRTSLPGNHPNTATILNSMGRLRMKQGDPRAAEPFFREAVSMRASLFGEYDPLVSRTTFELVDCLKEQHQYNEAESILLSTVENAEDASSKDEALNRLAELYNAWGRPEKAEASRLLVTGTN